MYPHSEITADRIISFRKKLREEMFGSQLWYHPPKEKNKDVMYIDEKNGIKMPMHRWVWMQHHPNEEIKYNELIHHINGNHQDNRIENLEKLKMKQHGLRHKELKSKNNNS